MAGSNTGVLLDLNANKDLNFLSSNSHYFSADENINPYESVNIESKYHDPDSFISTYKNLNVPVFLNINVQSLTSKYDNLKQTILSFISSDIYIPIIAVQEIWQIPHPESVTIPGYKFTCKLRKTHRGGG
jgi:hypothetical protein